MLVCISTAVHKLLSREIRVIMIRHESALPNSWHACLAVTAVSLRQGFPEQMDIACTWCAQQLFHPQNAPVRLLLGSTL